MSGASSSLLRLSLTLAPSPSLSLSLPSLLALPLSLFSILVSIHTPPAITTTTTPGRSGRLLSPRDLEVAVRHGTPFIFQNGHHSASRMTSFLHQDPTTRVLDTETAQKLDLMRFLLSYAANHVEGSNNVYNRQLVESSVRNLLAKLCYSVPESNSSGGIRALMTVEQIIRLPLATRLK